MSPGPYDAATRQVAGPEFRTGDFVHANCPGVRALTMHPYAIGSKHRMLERVIDRIGTHEGVVSGSLGDHARRRRAENPLEEWKAENRPYAGGSR